MINFGTGRRGQALLLVTLSLFAMCGLLGLAVDLGWSYFVKKSAQSAADAAAFAAAYQALNITNGETVTPFPSPGAQNGNCDLGGNLQVGCQYAEQNDFNPGGHGGRQKINIRDGLGQLTRQDLTVVPGCPVPGTSGCVEYWVTVRTVEAIPQLFSAVLGNTTGVSSALATAAVVQSPVNGSLITLNRADPDAGGPYPTGVSIASGTTINAVNGVVVASNSASAISGAVTPPIIARKPVANPGLPDGPQFLDPLRGYGQPPLPSTALNTYAVIGGNMSGSTGGVYQFIGNSNAVNTTQPIAVGGTATLPSGNYVPGLFGPGCVIGGTCLVNLGAPALNISNTVTFNDAAPFGYYFFYGGLNVVAGGKMITGPGEYVFVGGSELNTAATAAIDGAGGAGAIIILTGSSGPFTVDLNTNTATGPLDLYPNLLTQINSNKFMVTMAGNGQFAFTSTTLSAGADTAPVTGLDPTNSALPLNLQPFGGIVLWQDQANSSVQYMPDGNIGCGGGVSSPCPRTPVAPVTATAPQLTLPGAALGLNGTIYQPRGAWITVSNGAALTGSLQIITGAVAGGAITISQPPTIPLRRRIVALIE